MTDFFRNCNCLPASRAFSLTADDLYGRPLVYRSLPDFLKDMPYFCLRIPTGGGKTWLAAKAVSLVNLHLLRTEYGVFLWLVPSDQIREQTLAGLKDRDHPLHAALQEAGAITVLSLDEAKSVTRATLDTSTTVIVATRQSFQVENEKNRKVYENNGALQHHFDGILPIVMNGLLHDVDEHGNDTVPYSLANVLRLRRPFVIVDEAHNNRTDLAFGTLAKFSPSGIMELTATPDTTRSPSNILYSVSAAELKAEEMIKLPIVLQTVSDWRQCLADAIDRRDSLQSVADKEWTPGTKRMRPIALIQAEARSSERDTLHTRVIKEELVSNYRIPQEEIAIATGEEKGLEEIAAKYPLGLADPACPIKYVVTQRALAEGWDCPTAYILVSVDSLKSATAIEQLLGRILRQPGAKRRTSEDLNRSYAFVASRSFAETASALRDKLVEAAGFERKDVRDFVVAATPEQARLDIELPARFEPVTVTMPPGTTLSVIPKALSGKIHWDSAANALTIESPLSVEEIEQAKSMVADNSCKVIIEQAAEAAAEKRVFIQFPAELGFRVIVPQLSMLSLLNPGKRAAFADPQAQLDVRLEITPQDIVPTQEALNALNALSSEKGLLDVTEKGQIIISFQCEVLLDLERVYKPENWDDVRLAAWLCKKISAEDMAHETKMSFVIGWMNNLLLHDDFHLARVIRQKSTIRSLLEQKIADMRAAAMKKSYQQALFTNNVKNHFFVDRSYVFEFNNKNYFPPSCFNGKKWGLYRFQKHFYRQIADFDTREEFECACWLDNAAVMGKIKYWVRNLVRNENAFSLQQATRRFYPDFVCVLPDEKILVVEYKGADKWDTPKVIEDRKIGQLWAELSNGLCKFVMIKDKNWKEIEKFISSP